MATTFNRLFGTNEKEIERKRAAMALKVSYLKQLKSSIKAVHDHYDTLNGDYLEDKSFDVIQLIYILEVCLFHGLRPIKDQSPHFWGLLESLKHRDGLSFGPSVDMILMAETPKTPFGRCRAWVRMILNQNSVEFSLKGFCSLPDNFKVTNFILISECLTRSNRIAMIRLH